MPLGFGPEGCLPVGVPSSLLPAPQGDLPFVLAALYQFLITILPVGVLVVWGQDNRTPEPSQPVFVVITPIRHSRLATNQDNYADCKFVGSMNGNIMTVTEVLSGSIGNNTQIFGVGVLPRTATIDLGTGGGGPGIYGINNSQIVSSRILSAGVAELVQSTEVTVQIDVHGTNSTSPPAPELVEIITTAIRDSWAADWYEENFPGIAPLYADEAMQIPFINAEQQYENRWVIEAHFEIDPTVILPLRFADEVRAIGASVEFLFPF